MKAIILTLFPEMFPGTLGFSLAGKGLEKGLWSFETMDIRDFALDKHKTWSLADALSEETEAAAVGATPVAGGAAGVPPVQPLTSPLVNIPLASSSRLIAFLGSIVILFLFLGFGLVALYDFATMGALPPSTSSVKDYLLTGLTLFAPYAVNKFSSLFEGLTPKKT